MFNGLVRDGEHIYIIYNMHIMDGLAKTIFELTHDLTQFQTVNHMINHWGTQ